MKKHLNKIICADSLEIMKKLPDKCIDLILTDPPYGIRMDKIIKQKANTQYGKAKAKGKDYGDTSWDNEIPKKEYFDQIFRVSKNQVIFGGNYFVEYLKNSSCWIIWDKNNTGNFADAEIAWTSFKSAIRIFKYTWHGMLQENMKQKEIRQHPTQKPVELFRWILSKYSEEGQTVLDPFAGSCTTARACKDLKRNFICIEKIQKYCDIGEERLKQEILF